MMMSQGLLGHYEREAMREKEMNQLMQDMVTSMTGTEANGSKSNYED